MADLITVFHGSHAYRYKLGLPYAQWSELFSQTPRIDLDDLTGPRNLFMTTYQVAYSYRTVGHIAVRPINAASLSRTSPAPPTNIAGGPQDQFYISVDGGIRQLATVSLSGLTTKAAVQAGLQSAIRALGGAFVGIVVDEEIDGAGYLIGARTYAVRGSTTTTSSKVVITSVGDPNRDLAAILGLGITNGGIEVWGEDVWPVGTVELHFDVFGNGPADPIPAFRFWWAECYRDPDPEYNGIYYGELIAPMTPALELGAIDSWGANGGEPTHYMIQVPVTSTWAPKRYSAVYPAELGFAIKLEEEEAAPTHFCWTREYSPEIHPEPQAVWNNTTAWVSGAYLRIRYLTHPPTSSRIVTPLVPGPPQARGGKPGSGHRTRP